MQEKEDALALVEKFKNSRETSEVVKEERKQADEKMASEKTVPYLKYEILALLLKNVIHIEFKWLSLYSDFLLSRDLQFFLAFKLPSVVYKRFSKTTKAHKS